MKKDKQKTRNRSSGQYELRIDNTISVKKNMFKFYETALK